MIQDRVEKVVMLRAPVERVWKALADAREFGKWFGVELIGEFAAGKTLTGKFDDRLNEAAIHGFQTKLGLKPSKLRLPDKDTVFCTVVQIDPPRYFSFRWIPFGVDAEADIKDEPTTLVEFRLEPSAEGTLLKISESGFQHVPAHRRERAFRMNDSGWEGQANNLKSYVENV